MCSKGTGLKSSVSKMIRGYSILLLAVVLGVCFAEDPDLNTHWKTFKKAFKKNFPSSHHENVKRLRFEMAVKSVQQHNLQADMGLQTYKKAINEFSDYTQEEIEAKLCGLKLPLNGTRPFKPFPFHKTSSRADYPTNFDWRNKNAVSSVKNQGTCGSCWTFAVSGALEGMWALRSGKIVDLSQQQLLDCSGSYGTQGCGGGWPDDAFKYVKANGIGTASCYPYENQQKQCRYNTQCKVTGITEFYDVPRGDENALLDYLFKYGPISVCVYVNNNFSGYSGGVYFDNTCTQAVNHAVLLVGYGVDNGVPYWTIKNSWGSGWGEKGYIRIARNRNNLCQVANYASFPYLQ